MHDLRKSCNPLSVCVAASSTSRIQRTTSYTVSETSIKKSTFITFCESNSHALFLLKCLTLGHQELGYVTSEKQTPSPIDVVANIHQAVMEERKATRNGSKLPLKDVLGVIIAQYNRMTTIKRHRIDGARRSLIYNMPFGLIQAFKTFTFMCFGLMKPLRYDYRLALHAPGCGGQKSYWTYSMNITMHTSTWIQELF